MHWLRRLRARIKYRGFDADLRHELDVHRAMTEDDLVARGLAGDDARRQAVLALGNVTLEREHARRSAPCAWILRSRYGTSKYYATSISTPPVQPAIKLYATATMAPPTKPSTP